MRTNGKWQTIPLLRVALFLISGMLLSVYLSKFIDVQIQLLLFAVSFLTNFFLSRYRVGQSVVLSVTIFFLGMVRMGMADDNYDGSWNVTEKNGFIDTSSQRALQWRARLLCMYDNYDFTEEQKPLIYAITLGDKSLLNRNIRSKFSTSGSSHILALSGLHAGIVFTLFQLLFRILFSFVRNYRHRQRVTLLLTLPAIWYFALLTGSSPSVIRATMMLTVYSIARLLSRDGISLNILSFTAILMLLIHPHDLFDIGFQLSFLSVLGIIVIYKSIVNIFQQIHNPLIRWSWELFVVSTAAQITTAPLAAYYFHQFSLMYFLSNLVIIPCVTLLLYHSIFFMLFQICPFFQTYIIWAMKILLQIIQDYNDWCAMLPHPVISDIHWTLGQLLAVYGLLLTLFLVFRIILQRKLSFEESTTSR